VHWVDVVAERLAARGARHRVASGTSISGLIQIGNAGDVIYADGIARALRERAASADVVWIADDVDPLRAVPKQLPPSFSEHLGKPVCELPDPEGCHERFTDHFIAPFLEALRAIGVEPIEKRGSRMYLKGEYDEAIRVSLEKAEQIRQILVKVAGSKKPAGWLPFDAICERCGRIATTDAVGLDGDRVLYRCQGGVAGKKEMVGCGNEGAVPLRRGKLTWRVEWAARWKILGITCEPFGKEHSAAGGSYDTSKVISKEIFDYDPPEPVLYEHILVDGEKMSKSKGNVIALEELLEVLPPEAVRYFYFRVDPNKHKDFDPQRKLLPLVEEYERTQAIAMGRASASRAEDPDHMRRSFKLSQVVAGNDVDYGPIPFSHLLMVAQLAKTANDAVRTLARSGFEVPAHGPARHHLEQRMALARRFADRYVPADERTEVAPLGSIAPLDRLGAPGRAFLIALASALEKVAWEPTAIHDAVFHAAKAQGVSGSDGFRSLYLALLGREKGPRAGYFIASLDRTYVTSRLREVGTGS
jgi:lysyl-tRNA synthetase class 1